MSETSTSSPVAALWRLSDQELAAALIGQEVVLRTQHARMLELLGEAQQRGLPASVGYRGLTAFLREELHLSARDIRQRLAQVEATQPARAMAGEPRPAPLAATGEALAAGGIGAEHVAVIARVFARCPAGVPPEERAELEATLVDLAKHATPDAVREAGRKIIAFWDADGTPPNDSERAEPRRELRYRHKRNGDLEFSGILDAETGATLEGLLGPLAKPRPAEDGEPDPRTCEQRHGDALGEIIDLAARAEELTVQGGERAVLTATVALAELEERTRRAVLDVPGCTTVEQLRRLACEAEVVPAIFGADGEVLYLGRSTRHATRAQRRALALRDKGCSFPGCDRSPKWCVAHHILMWSDEGPTDIENLVLLCGHHHRVVHHTGWEVRLDPATKLPEFLPPARLDPERRPLRNTAHEVLTRAQRVHRKHARPSTGDPWRHARGGYPSSCPSTRKLQAPAEGSVA